MWITHVGGKFPHGLLEKSLILFGGFFRISGLNFGVQSPSVAHGSVQKDQGKDQKSFKNPNPTGLGESTAAHLQFVRECAPPFVSLCLLGF